jgi:subtilisin family serine protease
MSDPRLRFGALGLVLLVGGIVAFGLVTRPPAPPPSVQVASLDQAVELGLLDAEVLAELRSTGSARAIVHLDTDAILNAVRSTIGAERTEALIGAMTAAFKANKAAIRAALGSSVELIRDYERLGAFVATFHSEASLLAALQSNLVRDITADTPLDPTALGPATAPSRAWAGVASPSTFQGAGVAVGVLDTGVDPASYPQYFPSGSVAGTFEAAPEDNSADDHGHGTHVSSIVLLMAPLATVYVADVFHVQPRRVGGTEVANLASPSNTLAGMDWLIGLKQSGVNLRAVNISLGGGHFPPLVCSDRFHLAEAYASGIIPVGSAGNAAFEDDNGNETTIYQTGIGSTGCDPNIISVGSVTNGSCLDGSFDQVSRFSQSSEALDILAPGDCILAAGGVKSGTSMAAPHVAGAVAVLASARAASSYELWTALISTGPVITDPNSGIARHRLDVQAAVDYLLGTTAPLPTPDPGVLRGVAVGVSTLSPAESLAPGETFDFDPVAVRNVGSVAATYDAAVGESSGGFVTVAPASWFTVAPASMVLGAGELGAVSLRVTVPSDAAAGVYAAELQIADREGGGAADASEVVEVSFVVFGGSDEGSTGTGTGTGGGSGSDDLGELLDNPWVLLVGAVAVILSLRRLFGGSRRPSPTPPAG